MDSDLLLEDALYHRLLQRCSAARREKLETIQTAAGKRNSLAAAVLLDLALQTRGIREQNVKYEYGETGKPSVCGIPGFHFSISHSKEAVVCAVSDRKIGADIEKMRNLETRIARISCTDSDLEFIFGSATIPESFNNESLFRFFRLWTAKEAYFKYCGTGIVKLKDISFKDIKDKCQMQVHGDYMITIYED